MQKDFEKGTYRISFNKSRKHIIWLDFNKENYTSFA